MDPPHRWTFGGSWSPVQGPFKGGWYLSRRLRDAQSWTKPASENGDMALFLIACASMKKHLRVVFSCACPPPPHSLPAHTSPLYQPPGGPEKRHFQTGRRRRPSENFVLPSVRESSPSSSFHLPLTFLTYSFNCHPHYMDCPLVHSQGAGAEVAGNKRNVQINVRAPSICLKDAHSRPKGDQIGERGKGVTKVFHQTKFLHFFSNTCFKHIFSLFMLVSIYKTVLCSRFCSKTVL